MLFKQLVVGLVSLATLLTARPSSSIAVLERVATVPQGWEQGAAVPASKMMKFRIAVHTKQASEFEQLVMVMSTPSHPSYGKHMSGREVKDFLRPSQDVSNAILSWLESEKVPEGSIEDDEDFIIFRVPVAQAERMLDTRFYYFQHIETGITRIRTLQYSIPLYLHAHIDMIQPTTRFGTFRPQRRAVFDRIEALLPMDQPTGYDPVFCNITITPDCLRGLYGLGNFTAIANVENSIGISGYLDQYARYSDLNLFLKQFAPYATSDNFTVVSINNGLNNQNSKLDSAEASLDVQYALSLSWGTPATYYSTGGRGEFVPDLHQPTIADNENEPYLEQLDYLMKLPRNKLPKVLTTSYSEDEQSVPGPYAARVCHLFAQLGALGVSVIFSSGDTGVGSACQTNDGKNTTRFIPNFPAACPWVTSVGGTYQVEPERAIYFSSGGFSDRFPRPAYQDAAVTAYLDKIGSMWEGLYNPNGRGFPDVAAQAYNFSIYDKGKLSGSGGTSCAAPTFAAVIADLNSIRLSQGKSTLGFLNPWIYHTGYKGLMDITVGGSTGCMGTDNDLGMHTPYVPFASWNATEGWDPVTGYGTPLFPELVALLP